MLFFYFLIGIPNRMAPLPVDVLGAQGGFVAALDVVNGLLGVLLLLVLVQQLPTAAASIGVAGAAAGATVIATGDGAAAASAGGS